MALAYKYFRFPFASAGTVAAIPDTVQGDGSVSYPEGFGPDYALDPATQPAALNIPRDKSNQLYLDMTQGMKYLQEGKVPQWIAAADNGGVAFAYDFLALVLYTDGYIYQSIAAANNATPGASANWVRTRIRMAANTNFYILITGSNSNTGLVNSAGGAWLTLQFALDSVAKNYDVGGFQATINLGTGTFAGGGIGPIVGSGQTPLIINGNGAANTILNSNFGVGISGYVQVQNFKVTDAASNCLVSSGLLNVGAGIEFGACAAGGAQLYANNGVIQVNASYAISAGGGSHYQAFNVGKIIVGGGITATLSGTPAYAGAFANIGIQSLLNIAPTAIVFAGTGATGVRYNIDNMSLVAGTAAAANFFPGNSAGVNGGHGSIYN